MKTPASRKINLGKLTINTLLFVYASWIIFILYKGCEGRRYENDSVESKIQRTIGERINEIFPVSNK